MRVCAEPDCPELTTARRCQVHQAQQEQARGTRQQRGYDAEHMATRAALLPLAYGTRCPIGGPRCVGYMYPHHELHLHHSTPLAVDSSARGDQIVCSPCNLWIGKRHSE
jgi:hypothetical protein